MVESNKQLAVMAFSIGFGVGALFLSWFILSNNDHDYSAMAEKMEEVSTNLSGLDTAFNAMSVELRQLHVALTNDNTHFENEQSVQEVGQPYDDSLDDSASGADTTTTDNNGIAANNANDLTEQELTSVTLIVDKLRAHDVVAFPDFPSLMASPEMRGLSPAALDKIMAEISLMVEQGNIDPSFFPSK